MYKLIHLTDTHFIPKGETLYGRDPAIALSKAVEDINTHHADADLVTITGDLTHWGEPEAFEHLANVLGALKPKLRLLIGNHDKREIFARVFPDQALDQNGFVQSVEETAIGHLIFLDTNLEGTHAGWFCETRRAWLNERLAEAHAASAPVFLFMHHPPFQVGIKSIDTISLQEPESFLATLAPYKEQIRHLFFGHIHRPLCGSWRGIPVSSLRSMNHQVSLDFSSEGAIPGNFEQPAYCVALIDEAQVIIHTHDFMDASPRFSLRDSPVEDWATRYAHP